MTKFFVKSLALLAMVTACPVIALAGPNEDAITKIVLEYVPANTNFAPVKAEKVAINSKKKTVTVTLSKGLNDLPLTSAQVDEIRSRTLKALGNACKGYKLTMKVGKYTLEQLATDAKHVNHAPTETSRFVTPLDLPAAPAGLDGANIAVWQSHGLYFEPKLNRWEWQRARVQQTVEDLYTQSYVMPFLMPMLENAGAYVMSPRERDIQLDEYIVDNDSHGAAYKEHSGKNKWEKAPAAGFGYGGEVLVDTANPFRGGTARMARTVDDGDKASRATWGADIAADGLYAVYVSYQSLPNSAPDAVYTIHAANGDHRFRINQHMGGGTWIYLGHFPLAAGKQDAIVELTNVSATPNSVITADAVKIGGGMGNVARIVKDGEQGVDYQYTLSGYPRWTEGARYFLQWAGAPDSVFTPSENTNDYGDDYKCRGLWVNWLGGGSSMMPGREGLRIPVDLSLAFHTDAGTTDNDSIIGTLGIYCTQSDNGKYPNGTDRLAARDYTNSIVTNLVRDVRAGFEPQWTRRGLRDDSYFEARVPEVPAMLLEFLSHQNFADMKYGLDPAFRFTVSRAIYKGMLKYLADRDDRPYVVQPLPVNSFAITGSDGRYTLSWAVTPDSHETTATPTYYIIEERIGAKGSAFRPIATVTEPRYTLTVDDSDIHSFRIIAGNDGGRSFPSEVLALCHKPGKKQVLIVNGFTRISAPDWFDAGELAGFADSKDHGVPYVYDINYIGSQKEFRRSIPWMDDDACGFGDSNSDYEDKVVAGNTFDFVALHGEAIAAAGYGFISSSADAFAAGAGDAPIVDLILGKQKEIIQGRGAYGSRFKTFSAPLQQRLRAFAKAGGNIFVSGAFIGTDLWDNPFSSEAVAEADRKFANEVLGYSWRVDKASVQGEAYEVPCRFREFTGGEYRFNNTLSADCYVVEAPDGLYAPDDKTGATFLRYSNRIPAGTAFDGPSHRAVAIGFPFETILSHDSRASLMRQILSFLDK